MEDERFNRSQSAKYINLLHECADIERQIAKLQKKLKIRDTNRLNEYRSESFCEIPILFETQTLLKGFELVIAIKPDFRICAKAYQNAHDKKTFVAMVETWGINWKVPKWFKTNSKYYIDSFVEAKSISLNMLEEVINTAKEHNKKE